MANRIKKKQETKATVSETMALIMGIFVVAVLGGLPLVVTNAYFNILETKYIYFCICAIAAIAISAIYGLVSGNLVNYFKSFDFKKVVKGLSVADWGMLVFWFANVMSWIFCSDWRHEAFWGTSGRYNGVFLMTIYMAIYFLVTRFFVFRRWYLEVFLAVGLFVCLFGITDYFQMDLMGFKVRMVDYQKAIYTSTFGNINTYTIYAAVVLVVSTILFTQENEKKKILWYYVNMVVASFALIMGVSDNAYLSLAALFGLAPLYLFRTKTGVSRYLVSLATFFTVIMCINGINAVFADQVLGIDSAFNVIAGLSILPVIVIALWAAVAAMTMVAVKGKKNNDSDEMGKGLVYAWIGVIVLVIGAVAFAFYDATVAGNSERYGALASYVTFNDKWGTSRGYVWTCAIDIWTNAFDGIQKIFGYGADTFRLLMMTFYEPRMVSGRPVVYDSVHNEYLHYLLTTGIVGMVSYIVFLAAAVVMMCRRMKNHPEVAAVMFAVAAYAVQAVININLPIAMPIILVLLAMGLSKLPDEIEK